MLRKVSSKAAESRGSCWAPRRSVLCVGGGAFFSPYVSYEGLRWGLCCFAVCVRLVPNAFRACWQLVAVGGPSHRGQWLQTASKHALPAGVWHWLKLPGCWGANAIGNKQQILATGAAMPGCWRLLLLIEGCIVSVGMPAVEVVIDSVMTIIHAQAYGTLMWWYGWVLLKAEGYLLLSMPAAAAPFCCDAVNACLHHGQGLQTELKKKSAKCYLCRSRAWPCPVSSSCTSRTDPQELFC